jgi:hypothetical protein
MGGDPAPSTGALIFDGVEFTFCSLDCAHRFAAPRVQYAAS